MRVDPDAMDTIPDDLSGLYDDGHIQCVVISYGDGHRDAPTGSAMLVDARPLPNPVEDPEVRESVLHATGLDREVRRYVMATPRARRLVRQGAEQVLLLLRADSLGRWAGGQRPRADVHVVCVGGKYQSVAVAEEIAAYLRAAGVGCETEHRHIDRPLLAA